MDSKLLNVNNEQKSNDNEQNIRILSSKFLNNKNKIIHYSNHVRQNEKEKKDKTNENYNNDIKNCHEEILENNSLGASTISSVILKRKKLGKT